VTAVAELGEVADMTPTENLLHIERIKKFKYDY